MREIGGYIELDNYHWPMLHEEAVALNCGRNCLVYLIRTKQIKKIVLPYFLCDSVKDSCVKNNVEIRYYNINVHLIPQNVALSEDEWLYIVNYYGQLDWYQIKELQRSHKRIIIDNAQAYFDMPVEGIDTIYTCRKFLGVADGAFLYTDKRLPEVLEVDESFDRMRFLMGRYERTASEFYSEYATNNRLFQNEPLKKMSKLTKNLLHGIDYVLIRQRRTNNYKYMFEKFKSINKLELKEVEGAFAYPLWIENGAEIRKKLQALKIYIPTLWPNVLQEISENSVEYDMAENILPLPCDQRYNIEDMEYVYEQILMFYSKE